MTARPRLLFVSPDPVGEEMAGLGIRYYELARALAPDADVTVASGAEAGPLADVRTVTYRPHAPAALRPLIAGADAVVCPPQWPVVDRWLRRSGARVIHDLYTPETLETLELFSGRPPRVRRLMADFTLDRLHDALATGHHFMCASEKQRDLWIGALLAARRLGPSVYDRDPALREVIDVVPFGCPSEPPERSGPGLRERLAGVGPDDEVILWNGGIWRWLDAPTAIRAVAALAERRPKVRLVFMGGSDHPAAARAGEEARALARELGVLDRVVHFHADWVPYAERADWLLDADCAISTHVDHLESRFAFRTRLLDCFWARLPVVCTEGDDLAARVERDDLGAVVGPGDPAAAAAALERVLDRGRDAYAEALGRAASDHAWPVVAGALRRWVTTPGPLPPRLDGRGAVARTPGHRARALGYRAARRVIARRGIRAPRG